jgi:hypothetical protein
MTGHNFKWGAAALLFLALACGLLLWAQTPMLIRDQSGNQAEVDSSHNLYVNGANGTFPVTGTFWQTTQPVSAASLPLPSNAAQETGGNLATLAGLSISQGSTTSGQKGILVQCAVTTAAPSYTTAESSPCSLDTSGNLRVNIGSPTVSVSGSVAVTGTFWQATQPVSLASLPALAAGSANIGSVDVLGSAGNAVDAAPGSATPAHALQECGTDGTNCVVPYVDPCQRGAKTFTNINDSASGSTQIITGTSGKKTYICQIWLSPIGTATNVSFQEGTGTNCGTSTISISGAGGGGDGTSGKGAQLAANEGFTAGDGGFSVAQATVAADNVCVALSAANQVSGGIVWVQY